MSKITKVLFVCLHNSGRSQMAEAYLRRLGGDRFDVESAGFEPRPVNPLVVEAMLEEGFDLTRVKADSVFDFYKDGRLYNYVIGVCDSTAFQRCPVFPGLTKRLHWPFPDPAELQGTHEERLQGVRKIRDAIEQRIKDWLKEVAAQNI
jgi:arsenate reductase (thioredoxin)